ncbi:hypothetical protein EHO58_19000 [Leptospira selangorensis]|uniref:hypothetical protein n=1 Tax=Leptospira selangorensis TaxID=2484982 RepID=UPI00108427E6|nr:hypothetical protein [Leptospira selangorensis]TGK00539.1 hypothetical protein EHO58_19000 [Leptospira selangorensis]
MESEAVSNFMDRLIARCNQNGGERCYVKIFGNWYEKKNAKNNEIRSYTIFTEDKILKIYFTGLQSLYVENPSGFRIDGGQKFSIRFATDVYEIHYDIKEGYGEWHRPKDRSKCALEFLF